MKKIFNFLNPRFSDFIERNPKKRMLGLYWAFLWRFFLFFYGSIIVFALVFGGISSLYYATANTTDYAPTQGQGLDFVSTAKRDYDSCVLKAENNYLDRWDEYCAAKEEDGDCSLSSDIADRLGEDLDQAKDTCLELYKLELK